MNNRNAAGLRRSAIAARIRIREEWSELKGPEEPTKPLNRIPEIIRKQLKPVRSASKLAAQKTKYTKKKTSPNVLMKRNQNINVPISDRNMDSGADALAGVVALVDVGTETRALALRAALMALGATVVPAWSPFVTHLVWTQGGCRDTRAKARALACRLVSPLWVEACASCSRRVTEAAFPAATRPSDLPSPRALRIMLKRAEAENIPLADLLNNQEPNNPKEQRLRISSETENNTTADTTADTSTDHDTSTDKNTSHDRSKDSTGNEDNNVKKQSFRISSDCEHNTTADTSTNNDTSTDKDTSHDQSKDSTGNEADNVKEVKDIHDTTADTTIDHDTSTDGDKTHDQSKDSTDPTIRVNTLPRGGAVKMTTPAQPKSRRKLFTQKEAQDLTEDDDDTPIVPKRTPSKLTVRTRRDLARAERMARRMLGAARAHQILAHTEAPTIVLTGMSRTERQSIQNAIKSLNGKVQKLVTARTTHVVLGSCVSDRNHNYTGVQPLDQTHTGINTRCQTTNTRYETPINTRCGIPSTNTRGEIPSTNTRYQITSTNTRCEIPSTNTGYGVPSTSTGYGISITQRCGVEKARTLNALLGAARGCRVVWSRWVTDSVDVKKWLHHHGYEVPHLRKMSQKARVERTALGRTCADYAYDVFRGMRVRISPHTEQKHAAVQLLTLCGGVVQDGGAFQDGGESTADFDVCVGNGEGEVNSKWVFDSVAAGRMRTTRRYVNLGVENGG